MAALLLTGVPLPRPEAEAPVTVGDLFQRRAELLRELAELEVQVGQALTAAEPPPEPDRTLTLAEAADFLGEPASTFRRRLEYRKALVSRPGQRRLRYSRAALDRIKRDQLEAHGAE